ncbi:A24 family peptidase [Methanonatronarchaeum sp. AMET-Sl]|uniref:A24 family peptidase n=1 Tax=Methanonatronarchaeum sp. AMET-Sl TaxID=3037654 RepID=UPI00244E582E|nr:A24 family peptidase [Methanonatronarchaeum sp. AMET-Sl]WGI16724.1 prepilin peptidase [Methanonatronarchaeum sp. AMET-Sl]
MDIDLIKILVILPFFIIACITDLKDRRVPNKLWIPLIIIAVIFGAIQYTPTYITMLAISLTLILIIVFIMAALQFGGADLKALIIIALIFPVYPETFNPIYGEYSVFALSTIINALFLALIYPIAITITNLIRRDLERPRHIFRAIKKPINKVNDKERVLYKGEYKTLTKQEIETISNRKKTVWTTPWMPFIVFITLGMLTTIYIGDLMYIIFNHLI